ncbi:hypothetical protein [Catenulispora acidiphila]|uniref:hypothetical protein n=1 Tax=Catenulispora acidiphila TaxID=304895 RepID=UPI00019DF977|nr:hypothetical protein [Catenulispora acidiphila]
MLTFLAVVAVAVVGLFIWGIHREFRDHRPPDVAKIAHSAPVQSADHDATDELNARVAALPQGQTWLIPGPTAVQDQCQSMSTGEFTTVWQPVTCQRTITAYYSFNGDFVQRMETWGKALNAAGWVSQYGGDALGQPLDYYKKMAHQPEPQAPNRTYLADDLPPSERMCHRETEAHPLCLTISWAERPRTTTAHTQYQGPDITAAVIQQQKVDPAAVESTAYPHEQYLAIVTLTDTYYDADADAPRPAPSPLTTYTPCYSGSGTCN